MALLPLMDVTDIFKVPDQKIKPQTGRLLIAEPFMQDPYFKRSVVFLTEHNERGSFGLILNKPIPMYLNEVIENAPVFDSKLGLGGPVQNETLHYLHTKGSLIPNSKEVMSGIYWGGDFDAIKRLILSGELKPSEIRLFVGYAGWAEGQLAHELDQHSWIVSKANIDLLFTSHPEDLWNTILEKMGAPYSYMVNLPEDPRLN